MHSQHCLLVALVSLLICSTSDAATSLRGADNLNGDTKNKKNEPGFLANTGSFVSRHLIRAAATSTDIMYRRTLESKPVRPQKVKNMLALGKSCMYDQRMRIGDCFTDVVVENNVLSDGFLPQTLMAGSPVLKGMLEFEARPYEEMEPWMKRDFLPEHKANEIVATMGLLAEDSHDHGEFKKKVMNFLKQEQSALKLGVEAMDSVSIFLDVADFE